MAHSFAGHRSLPGSGSEAPTRHSTEAAHRALASHPNLPATSQSTTADGAWKGRVRIAVGAQLHATDSKDGNLLKCPRNGARAPPTGPSTGASGLAEGQQLCDGSGSPQSRGRNVGCVLDEICGQVECPDHRQAHEPTAASHGYHSDQAHGQPNARPGAMSSRRWNRPVLAT